MLNLFDSLPETIHVSGYTFPILSDFRYWLKFEAIIDDDNIPETDKLISLISLCDISGEIPDISQIIDSLITFYRCGKSELTPIETHPHSRNNEQMFSLTQDAPLIYAGFLQAYHIDLTSVSLHWWAFRALLDALPDSTKFAQIISIRAADTSYMSKRERERFLKLKRMFAISDKKPKSLKQRDEELIKKYSALQKK